MMKKQETLRSGLLHVPYVHIQLTRSIKIASIFIIFKNRGQLLIFLAVAERYNVHDIEVITNTHT